MMEGGRSLGGLCFALFLFVLLSAFVHNARAEFSEEAMKNVLIKQGCGANQTCCDNYNQLPSWFWDWLLLPLAIEDAAKNFKLLSGRLAEINGLVCDVDYSQIETSVDFGEVSKANYEWFQSPNGPLSQFNEQLDIFITALTNALDKQGSGESFDVSGGPGLSYVPPSDLGFSS